MEARRLFLQSVKDKGADVNNVLGGQLPGLEDRKSGGDRQRYLSLLGTEFRKDPSSSGEMHPTVVKFSLHDLLEFKGTSQTLGAFKQQREPARKRPNYDNSRRAMFANPEVRVKKLMLCPTNFIFLWCFEKYRVWFCLTNLLLPPFGLRKLKASWQWSRSRSNQEPVFEKSVPLSSLSLLLFAFSAERGGCAEVHKGILEHGETYSRCLCHDPSVFESYMGLDGFVVILEKFGALMRYVWIRLLS